MSLDWPLLMPRIIHDVRALVRKGLSSTQLVQRKLGDDIDPEVAGWLKSVTSAQTDINVFIMRIGALAQADKPPSADRKMLLDLGAALLNAKMHSRDLLTQSEAEFSIGPIPDVKVPSSLETAWMELISNSCRFRHPDRPLKIHVDASENENSVSVQIADNGSGWDPAFADLLFQPLQRLDPQRSGFGLGLAIARAAVDSVGGEIRAESGSPGARFTVRIPVQADA